MKWHTAALGDIATIVGGSTPSRDREEYWNGSIRWLTPTDLPMPGQGIAEVTETTNKVTDIGLASSSAQLLPVGTVLFSSRATIGKIGISRVPLATNQGFANFIPKKILDAKYLAYCLCYFTKEISALAGSTTFKEVSKTSLKRFRIPLPPLSEQWRIVEILDQADMLRKKRSNTDAKAARILPSLFYKIFGNPITNSKNWPCMSLGQVLSSIDGGWSPRCLDRPANENEWGVLKLGAVTWGQYIENENKALPSGFEPRTSIEVRNGDVLFSRKNTHELVAACTMVHNPRPRIMISDLIFRLNIKDKNKLLPEYLSVLLGQTSKRTEIQQLAAGAAGSMPNISKARLKLAMIPIPPIQIQRSFQVILNRYIHINGIRQRSEVLIQKLFQSIFHKAFTGDLTAEWREAHMKELLKELEFQTKYLEEVSW